MAVNSVQQDNKIQDVVGSYKLLNDLPYEQPNDPLDYSLLATQLKHIILNSKNCTPLIIGIQGGWGVGKSSLICMLKNQLKDVNTGIVDFNAWSYKDKNITERLIKTILYSIDDNKLIRKYFRRRKARSLLKIPFSAAAGYFGAEKAIDQAWDMFTKDADMKEQFNKLFNEVIKAWIKKNEGNLLVVFIDDLDRCDADRVMDVLEAVKLYLGVQNMVFVVGYDRDPIATKIEPKIGVAEFVTGSSYLEKIIQIPFNIPLPDYEKLKKYLNQCLQDANAVEAFEGLEEIIIKGNEENPRKIKLFINSFIIQYIMCTQDNSVSSDLLCRRLLIVLYFPKFTRKYLNRPRYLENVRMLIDYSKIKNALAGNVSTFSDLSQDIQDTLKSYEAKNNVGNFTDENTVDEIIQNMNKIFPEDFGTFVGDRQLMKLVEELATQFDKITDNTQLEKAMKSFSKMADLADDQMNQKMKADFAYHINIGAPKVLWVDDHPENNEWIRKEMIPDSIDNTVVKSTEEAFKLLLNGEHFDLIVSDISRGDNPNEGFRMLEELRNNKFDIKTIFFPGRVTSERRKIAEELHAYITSDPQKLARIMMEELKGVQ